MPPFQGGGDMIRSVTFEKTEFAEIPNRFEAGTPAHRQAPSAWRPPIDYVTAIGIDRDRGARTGAAALRHGAAD